MGRLHDAFTNAQTEELDLHLSRRRWRASRRRTSEDRRVSWCPSTQSSSAIGLGLREMNVHIYLPLPPHNRRNTFCSAEDLQAVLETDCSGFLSITSKTEWPLKGLTRLVNSKNPLCKNSLPLICQNNLTNGFIQISVLEMSANRHTFN